MRKTKAFKRNKYSKKTRKNINYCEKGETDESRRIKKFLNELREKQKLKISQKVTNDKKVTNIKKVDNSKKVNTNGQ